MVDMSQLRKNMVESQVMTCDVTDRRVLRAMLEIERERFVPEAQRALAYMDEAVQLTAPGVAPARFLPAPMITGKLIALADIDGTESVLEIGSATGYATAILARLARSVVGIEADAGLSAVAAANLKALAVSNATIVQGPHAAGLPRGAPYDVIMISGCIPEMPEGLGQQLREGGRIIAVAGEGAATHAVVFDRRAGQIAGRTAFSASAPVLPGFEKAAVFAL